MSTLRQKTRRLLLTLLAKLIRTLILTIARLILKTKPNPDSIEYILASTPTTNNTNISSKNPTHRLKIHIYNPSLSSSPHQPSPPTTPTPVLITLPGTGFITPSLGLDAPYCASIASSTAYTVIDVGYRLAPENPFPCALEDLVSVTNWVRSQPDRFDIQRIWVGGFSAGGNIAISGAVSYLGRGVVRGIVGIYPVVDAHLSSENGEGDGGKNGNGVVKGRGRPEHGGLASVPGFLMRFFRACYLIDTPFCSRSDEDVLRDPRVSPIHADVDRFPARCLFITAEHDSLAKGAEDLAERIRRGSTDGGEEERRVVVHRVSGCGHAFDKGVKKGSERERIRDAVYEVIAGFLREG
ncbi:Alpha/Beta hydrolase protein [Aspergillus spectabilis]